MPRAIQQSSTAKRLVFGTAGIPHTSRSPHTTQNGIIRVGELSLGCMEVEFVQGVRMSQKTALAVGEVARKRDIFLTAHAPYYINLNSLESEKVQASRERILQTARIASAFSGNGITFHAAFYMKMSPERVYETVKKHVSEIVEKLDKESKKLWIRPEVMGKPTQFGTLNEVLRLSSEIKGVAPCIDFAHLHVSGIRYGDKGERNHLNLEDSDLHYVELLQALKDHDARGILICESPNLEEDAALLQRTYRTL